MNCFDDNNKSIVTPGSHTALSSVVLTYGVPLAADVERTLESVLY